MYGGGSRGVDTCGILCSIRMTDKTYTPVIAFDPGSSTGVAVLSEYGEILFTTTLSIIELEHFMNFMLWVEEDIEVVVEQGPEYGHHSPVTRSAESIILEVFEAAHRVLPGHWKSHPSSSKPLLRGVKTRHEHDAVRLAQWFQETGETNAEAGNSTRQDDPRSRRKRK